MIVIKTNKAENIGVVEKKLLKKPTMLLLERRKKQTLYNLFTEFCDFHFFQAIAERKYGQLEARKCDEIVEGMPKTISELYWEFMRFKRQSIERRIEFVNKCKEALKDKIDVLEIQGYFKDRGIDLDVEREIRGIKIE